MATKLCKVPANCIIILTWNIIYLIQEYQFSVFFLILHKICVVFIIYLNLLLGNVLPWLPTIQSDYNDNLT